MNSNDMKKQDYSNHTRYYAPHHFIFYPVVALSFVTSIFCIFIYPDHSVEWIAMAFLFLIVGWLAYMLRQHYALTNQNRIVRLEMRLRYFELTQKSFIPLESRLSFKQIAALRFASDEELLPLIEKSVTENLSPDNIKRSIKNWQPDVMRV
jgi:hypothetical protein